MNLNINHIQPETLEDPMTTACIELRVFSRVTRSFSVQEYETGIDRARSIATRRGLSWRGLAWTRHAPPAHMLTIDWQGPSEASFRVSDWETFNLQMLRAMGVL